MPDRWLALPHRKQENRYTCTPACVRMVLAFFGQRLQEDEIARLLQTDSEGTLLSQVRNIEPLGFDVAIGPGTYEDLQAAVARGTPVITPVEIAELRTHVGLRGGHCIVVAGATRRKVAIYDPLRDYAPDVISASAFMNAWREKGCRMAVLTPLLSEGPATASP